MKLAPLKDYREPGFPTQEILRHHPDLLRVLPRRWHSNPVVLGALAGLLALMEQSIAKAEDKPTLRVAPIFEHGKGVGSFGCMSVSPPVFLTEEEARGVIEEECKKVGVEFSGRGHKIGRVPVPFVEKFVVWEDPKPRAPLSPGEPPDMCPPENTYRKKGPKQTREVKREMDVELTGWNSKKQIGYRFVSWDDFEAKENRKTIYYEKLPDGTLEKLSYHLIGDFNSVRNYDVRGAAQRLVTGLGKVKEPGVVGVFYDPACDPSGIQRPSFHSHNPTEDKALNEQEKKAREEEVQKAWTEYRSKCDAAGKAASAEELREQVRDYLAWLKAQGVI